MILSFRFIMSAAGNGAWQIVIKATEDVFAFAFAFARGYQQDVFGPGALSFDPKKVTRHLPCTG